MSAAERVPLGRDIGCRQCAYFAAEETRCTAGGRTPLRSCVIAINQILADRLTPGGRVLEIGCGSWSELRRRLAPGVEWHGIDVVPSYEGRPTLATALGSVAAIPYATGAFDVVLANQSMEHWFEYGVTLATGLAEISRVLRVGGEAWLNVPIHLHGHRIFLAGEEGAIARALLKGGGWEVVSWERWRREPEPLGRYAGWRLSNDVEMEHLIPHAETANSWVLNVVLRKTAARTQPWPSRVAQWAASGAYRIRPLGGLVRAANRGPRFLVRKAARRLGLVSALPVGIPGEPAP
jgi:SAM-dependent methyltransferase